VLAPLGTAILGYRVGDVIDWPMPSGARQYKILGISYQPEAAGDYHL
jgi:regulator of nucleoside diphosphate kinase